MGRQVTIDLATGAGSSAEFLVGTVTVESNAIHYVGNTLVLPDPVELPLFNGKATHPDMAVSPAGPEPQWAYKFTFKSGVTGRAWSQFAGVPDGTGPIDYKQLPKFTTAVPPETTAEQVQNWATTAQDGAERAEAAADRAEAAYGAVVLVPVPDADNLVSTVDYWVLRKTDTTPLLAAGTKYILELTPTASFTLAELQTGPSPTGASMVDTIATNVTFVAGVKQKFEYTPSRSDLMYLRVLAHANDFSTVEVFTETREDKLVELREIVDETHEGVDQLEGSVYGVPVPVLAPNQEIINRDNNYKTVRNVDTTPLFEKGVTYQLRLTPSATFTLPELQTGPSPTGSLMVDTLATNVSFTAGQVYSVQYTPTADGLMYLRIPGYANSVTMVEVYEMKLEGGLVDGFAQVSSDREHNQADSYHLAHKLNRSIAELRSLKNEVDSSVASLTQVQTAPGTTKTATVTATHGKLVRVGLHYGASRFTPSATEIFFEGASRKDFTDVRFFDSAGRMLKATLSAPVNLDLLEDSNLDNFRGTLSDGTIIRGDSGIFLSTDNGVTYTVIPGTVDVTTHASQVYGRKSMHPVYVDSADNIFAYAGGILYKLMASDSYATKKPVLNFSFVNGSTTVYPDIQNHAMDMDSNGVLFVGVYQEEYRASVYRSTDAGESFSLNWSDHGGSRQHIHHIHADKYSNKVYVGVDDGGTTFNGAYILVTSDGGATWSDISELGHEVRGRDYYPTYFGDGYKLGGGESYYNGGGTIYRSEDDVHFDIPVQGIGGVRTYADFGDDSVILAGVQHCKGNTENQILASFDKGKSWETIWRQLQPVEANSGKGWRDNYNATTLAGDTEPCAVMVKDSGGVSTLRVYKGGDHYYREAWVLLEDAPAGAITITAKTGYMMGYPYTTLQSDKDHAGLVYRVPLNEGIGRTVADSLGNVAQINGNDFEWDAREPVRYGDHGGQQAAPFIPSAGLKLTQGTTLNFGKIPALGFNKNFTVTFWINPDGLLMNQSEYDAKPKTLGILAAGDMAIFARNEHFGYTRRTATHASLWNTGYEMMRTGIQGYAYCDQYFYVAVAFLADGTVKTYINGTNYGDAPYTRLGVSMGNLSTGDFVIGSDLLQSAGYLSNIKVYNRIIPDAEILDMYRGL